MRNCACACSLLAAAAYGVSLDKDDKVQAKQRKKDDATKKTLVAALHSKALALLDRHKAMGSTDEARRSERLAAADAAVAALHKWAAPTEHVKLAIKWHGAHGRHATALTMLNESLATEKKPPSKEDLELQNELLDELGWKHWAAAGRAKLHVKFPPALPLVYKESA